MGQTISQPESNLRFRSTGTHARISSSPSTVIRRWIRLLRGHPTNDIDRQHFHSEFASLLHGGASTSTTNLAGSVIYIEELMPLPPLEDENISSIPHKSRKERNSVCSKKKEDSSICTMMQQKRRRMASSLNRIVSRGDCLFSSNLGQGWESLHDKPSLNGNEVAAKEGILDRSMRNSMLGWAGIGMGLEGAVHAGLHFSIY